MIFAYDYFVRIATDSGSETFDTAMVGDVRSATQLSRIYGVAVMDYSDEPETPEGKAWGGALIPPRDFRDGIACELMPVYLTDPGLTQGHAEMYEDDYIDLRNQRRMIASGSGWLVNANYERQINTYIGSGTIANLYSASDPLRIIIGDLKKTLKIGNDANASYSTVTCTLKAESLVDG